MLNEREKNENSEVKEAEIICSRGNRVGCAAGTITTSL